MTPLKSKDIILCESGSLASPNLVIVFDRWGDYGQIVDTSGVKHLVSDLKRQYKEFYVMR